MSQPQKGNKNAAKMLQKRRKKHRKKRRPIPATYCDVSPTYRSISEMIQLLNAFAHCPSKFCIKVCSANPELRSKLIGTQKRKKNSSNGYASSENLSS